MGTPAADMLDLIIARAPALIAVGVTSVSVDGLSVTLVRPPPGDAPIKAGPPAPRRHSDPLRDGSTYVGGQVPGFTRDEDKR